MAKQRGGLGRKYGLMRIGSSHRGAGLSQTTLSAVKPIFRNSVSPVHGKRLWIEFTRILSRELATLNRGGFSVSNPHWIQRVETPDYVGVIALVSPLIAAGSHFYSVHQHPKVRQQYLQERGLEAERSLLGLAEKAMGEVYATQRFAPAEFNTVSACHTLPYDFNPHSTGVHSFLLSFAFYDTSKDPVEISESIHQDRLRFHYGLYPADLLDRLTNGLGEYLNAQLSLARGNRLPALVENGPSYGSKRVVFAVMNEDIPQEARELIQTPQGYGQVINVLSIIAPYQAYFESLLSPERTLCLQRGLPPPVYTLHLHADPDDFFKDPDQNPIWFVINLSLDKPNQIEMQSCREAVSTMKRRLR